MYSFSPHYFTSVPITGQGETHLIDSAYLHHLTAAFKVGSMTLLKSKLPRAGFYWPGMDKVNSSGLGSPRPPRPGQDWPAYVESPT
ncbi:unnamed protein product, partial [Iphiclides podalirius]